MQPPKATCKPLPRWRLTLTLDSGFAGRDFLFLVADALHEKAAGLAPSDKDDADYLAAIANVIAEAVQRAEDNRQENIASIFD